MNTKELKSGKVNKDWIHAVPIIREELNLALIEKIKLDRPENALGEKLAGAFREGDYSYDRQPRRVTKILYFNKYQEEKKKLHIIK